MITAMPIFGIMRRRLSKPQPHRFDIAVFTFQKMAGRPGHDDTYRHAILSACARADANIIDITLRQLFKNGNIFRK